MSEENLSPSRIFPIQSDALRTQKALEAEEIQKYVIAQGLSEEEFMEWTELSAFNPFAITRRFEVIENRVKKKERNEQAEKAQEEQKILEVERLEEVSEQFQRKNPELLGRSLLLLRSRLAKGDSKEEILRKVLESYPDYSLADEALDFLIQTSDVELNRNIQQAKEELNALYGREIRAGRNMGVQARAFSEQGLGSPTALRDMYRDITGNPRDPLFLFDELSKNFSFEHMKSVIDFLLHSLGSDMKAKGPSIARAELYRLLTETRSLQAILGVYRFFKSRMKLIERSFGRHGLKASARLTFDALAKLFIKFLQERYPSVEKAWQIAMLLDLMNELEGQLIVYTQFRDAVRQVAPKLFRSEQHQHDVLMTFLETIEEIDDRLEEEKEKEDEDKEKKEKEEKDGPL